MNVSIMMEKWFIKIQRIAIETCTEEQLFIINCRPLKVCVGEAVEQTVKVSFEDS